MSAVREQVERRAKHRCEYCQAPQGICAYTFHIEHITPRAKGGTNGLNNYALACFGCNNAKAAHVSALDPESNHEVELFHPRKHIWAEHFAWTPDFAKIVGLSAIGRATVRRLKMNSPSQATARPLWVMTETWP